MVHIQDTRSNFDAKYVKRRGSEQRCAFSGSQNQNLTFSTLPIKSRNLGPDFDGTENFHPETA